jgi:hypothetical protein
MRKNKNIRDERFEFVFYINGNIIVQRFFEVPDYNPAFRKSAEVKELMDNLMGMNNGPFGALGMIPDSFKHQNMRTEWKDYKPYYAQTEEQVNPYNQDLFEKEDIFSLKIKVDRRTVGQAQFCGNYFPKYVRHFVDITGIIGNIISEIQDYMSLEEYTSIAEAYGVEV